MRINLNKKGNVAFSTVIVTSSILLVAGAALLLSMTDFSKSSNSYFNNELNNVQANACVEESLQKIRSDTNYNGNFSVTFPNGNCSITITTNSNYRNVSIVSTYNTYQTNITKKVDISQNPFVVSNN